MLFLVFVNSLFIVHCLLYCFVDLLNVWLLILILRYGVRRGRNQVLHPLHKCPADSVSGMSVTDEASVQADCWCIEHRTRDWCNQETSVGGYRKGELVIFSRAKLQFWCFFEQNLVEVGEAFLKQFLKNEGEGSWFYFVSIVPKMILWKSKR